MSDSILILAGEKSGEEHAMTFFPELKKKFPQIKFYGVGGEDLSKSGVEIIYHLKDFSSMGFSEVIEKIPFYFKAMGRLLHEVKTRETKVAILVDFQDFNLRLAKKLKKQGVEVLYYVAPQAWAWKEWRASVLGNVVNTLFCILPFEKKFFADRGVKRVFSIPHPLYTRYSGILEKYQRPKKIESKKWKIVLLPGSRSAEVREHLPIFRETVSKMAKEIDLELAIVVSSSVDEKWYDLSLNGSEKKYSSEELDEALQWADIALAASGTVTLACALFSLPTLVCYKSSFLNVYIFRQFIRYKGPASLANIIHGKMVFPEFLQENFTSFQLHYFLKQITQDLNVYNKMVEDLSKTFLMVSGDNVSAVDVMSEVITGMRK